MLAAHPLECRVRLIAVEINMKKAIMVIWFLIGLYFVIACLGRGNGVSAAMAMACGFMVARNMADVVKDA